MNIPKRDLDDLRYAKGLLEHPSFASKVTDMLGAPIEKGFGALPRRWSDKVYKVTRISLTRAMDVALLSIVDRPFTMSRDAAHRGVVMATGAAGGAFGLVALPMELPVSTVIMLRSIADIARSEGEWLKTPETKLACLGVFALGGASRSDDSAETGYFAVRAMLARAVSDAAGYIAGRSVAEKSAPALVRFITAVAARFSLVVSDKVIAQTVPVIGAAGGGLINTIFMDHFQDMARGHFIVRRLERAHGAEVVREIFERL